MSDRDHQAADHPQHDGEFDGWGILRPEGESLGQVVESYIDIGSQTLCVTTSTHIVRLQAFEDLRPDEIPQVGSEVVQLEDAGIALLSQVGNWNVMHLAEGQGARIDRVIPDSARKAAQRNLLLLVLLSGGLLIKLGATALETGHISQGDLSHIVQIGAALASLTGVAFLALKIWSWFYEEDQDSEPSIQPLKRTKRGGKRGQGQGDTKDAQRDWVEEVGGPAPQA